MKHSDMFSAFYESESFQKIAQEFVQSLPDRLAIISTCIKHIQSIDNLNTNESRLHLTNMSKVTHALVGTAGSVGFQELTKASKELEVFLNGVLRESSSSSDSISNPMTKDKILESLQSMSEKIKREATACSSI